MSISQNTALFSLLGTTYGGNGTTTFGLPDLRGRVPLHSDATYVLGEQSGTETVTLTGVNVPPHPHNVNIATANADLRSPDGALPAATSQNVYDPNSKELFNPTAVAFAGQSVPHNNLQPFTVINYIIALQGIFPQRP